MDGVTGHDDVDETIILEPQSVDMVTLQSQLDALSIGELDLNRKLIRALCLTIGLYQCASSPTTSRSLATVIETLGSALQDTSATPQTSRTPFPTRPFDPFGSTSDCEVAQSAKTTDSVESEWVRSSSEVPDALLRQLMALVRRDAQPASGTPLPPSLFGSVDWTTLAIGSQPAEGSATPTASTGDPAIGKLHVDLLTRILSLARALKDETSCECEQGCVTSRGGSQRWALSLIGISKSFKVAGRRAAYSHVRLRRRSQLSGLLKLITKDAPEIGEHIRLLDVKIPALVSTQMPGSSPLSHPRSRSRSIPFPWLAPVSPQPGVKHDADDVEPEEELAALVTACSTLSKLSLSISKAAYTYGWSAFGMAEFLEQGMEKALCQSQALRHLQFRQCVDFGEIESILLHCSRLEVLQLDSGIDNLDGADEVQTIPHRARLREFSLNSFEQSEIGEQQLAWILRPSVGSLARLELSTCISISPNGVAGFAPWGGSCFADVLVELAPTLTRLALKDSLSGGTGLPGTMNPSLRNLPHDGSFDYALQHANKLEQFAAEWGFLGAGILDVLATKPLQALAFLGSPTHVSGTKFCAALEDTNNFTQLQRLSMVHFAINAQHQLGGGGGPPVTNWTARDVRTLKRLATARRLQFEFSSI